MNAAAASQEPRRPHPLRSIVRGIGLLGPYYRLLEWRIAMQSPKPPRVAEDGKPLPDRLAMMRIGGNADWRFFYTRGKATAQTLVNAARAAGADPATWKSVLDWGCGCGRIARHMPLHTPAKVYGRDIDAYTIRWPRKHLAGDYRVSGLKPPLDLPVASMDFAYGFSVLTHLSAPMQSAWFEELARILKPGALAALTFHDMQHPAVNDVTFRREENGVHVTEWTLEGSNLVAAFQDISSIQRAAAPWFDLVHHMTLYETLFDQSLAVLRRKES
jgi:SAM-dependent methyltransferase